MIPRRLGSSSEEMRPLTEWRWNDCLFGAPPIIFIWTLPSQRNWSSKCKPDIQTITINVDKVEMVQNIRLLDTYISAYLTWTVNSALALKKAQQRLYFLRILWKNNLRTELLVLNGVIEGPRHLGVVLQLHCVKDSHCRNKNTKIGGNQWWAALI